ncbi:MAG: hypothetical protein ACPGYR_06550 [Chitinophagales bacterium]
MKYIHLFTPIFFTSMVFLSCQSDVSESGEGAELTKHGAERAKALCDCAMDDNMISMETMSGISDEATEDLEKCVRDVLENVKSDVADMEKEDQVDYLRDMMQGVFDTECYETSAMLGLSLMSLEDIVDLALSEDGLDELFGSSSSEDEDGWDDYDYDQYDDYDNYYDYDYDWDEEDYDYDYSDVE